MRFGDLNVPALLDSGSTRNLISNHCFSSIDPKLIVRKEARHVEIATAKEDQKLKTLFNVQLRVKVDNLSWVVPFLIVQDLHVDVILGMEFMRKTHMVLNASEQWVSFNFGSKNLVLPIRTAFAPYKLKREKPNLAQYLDSNDEPEPEKGPDLSHLSRDEALKASAILRKHSQVLTKKLGKTSFILYKIRLKDDIPVSSSPFLLCPPKMETTRQLVNKLVEDDVVELSTSSYASPAFPVPKTDNKWRLVVDYRRLNKKIQFENIPVPDMKTAFSFFGNAKYFCVIDLNQAYHQIPLDERSKEITAFIVPWNLYHYKRVPFGLSVGGCVLTRLIDKIFSDLKYKCLVNYLDDIVLYAESYDELMKTLDDVLSRLQKAGLTINPAKLKLAVKQFVYLGHLVSYRSVQIDPSRTQPIRDYLPPTTVKGIARLIGMVGFFSKFIPNFADKAAPLNALRRKNVKFVWGPEQQQAFDDLKSAITNPPILAVPRFDIPFILQTDASGRAVSGALLQECDGVRMPIAYFSKRLTDA